MKFEDLLYKDRAWLQYQQMILTMALYRQKPVYAIEYRSAKNKISIVIHKKSEDGNITTKRLMSNDEGAIKIKQQLNEDFPELEISKIDV